MVFTESRFEPTLCGELYRFIKDYLQLSHKDMADKLTAADQDRPITGNNSSTWATYKHKPSLENCRRIIDVFNTCIKVITKKKQIELGGYIRYGIDKSTLADNLKFELLEQRTVADLIKESLLTACQHNIKFDRIKTDSPELIKKYSDWFRNLTIVGVPNLPTNYMTRPDYIKNIKEAIINQNYVGIFGAKLGVYGMGGIGKTVLATAIAHDEEVRDAFPDGIFWVTLGRQANIFNSQRNIFLGTGIPVPDFKDKDGGRICLRNYFSDKKCLVILDDVWDVDHANYFNVLNDNSCLLMTTRIKIILDQFDAKPIPVDIVTLEEAKEIIAESASQTIEELPSNIETIINKCGRLFLVLCMVGAIVKNKLDKSKAWQNVLKRLNDNEKDYESFEKDNPDYQYPHLAAAIDVSLDNLKDKVKDLFFDFAIFPEDQAIPEKVFETLWVNKCNNPIKEYQVEEFLDLLSNNSLLTKDDQSRYSIHDILFDYIRIKIGPIGVTERHQELLSAYENLISNRQWYKGPNDGYFYQWLPWHLKQAGYNEELSKLLWDYQWYKSKIKNTSVFDLILDFTHGEGESLKLLKGALTLSSHIVNDDLSQLESQLAGRLIGFEHNEIKALLNSVALLNEDSWLRPLSASLIPPGGPLFNTLKGHTDSINNVVVTSNGFKAVSASDDCSLKVWDLVSGKELFDLVEHTDNVTYVAVTSNGNKAVSTSSDGTLIVWDLVTGKKIFPLIGHTSWVNHVAITSDGEKAVSASTDNTLIVWDLGSGKQLFPLIGHTDSVKNVAISYDGKKAVSASSDKTLIVWDLVTGKKLFPLKGHTDSINNVVVTSNGNKAVSASDDCSLKVWDLVSGKKLFDLVEHTGSVTYVAISPNGDKAVSTSSDETLIVWDLVTGKKIFPLIGHTSWVNHVAITSDGEKAVSASTDNTLIVWDLVTGNKFISLFGHTNSVNNVVITPNGDKAVSTSDDYTLKVWDLVSGKEFASNGHTRWVHRVSISPEGTKAVTASEDQTLKLWDLISGKQLCPLIEHTDRVNHVAISSDGKKAVSASLDKTLIVWDLVTGKKLFPLIGHTSRVNHVAITPDGNKAVSASNDTTLKVWDLTSGTELFSLIGHKEPVYCVLITPDGDKAVSASDDKPLKFWDIVAGKELFPLVNHNSDVNYDAIIPDFNMDVSPSYHNTLKAWGLVSIKETWQLLGHKEEFFIKYAVFSPDGNSVTGIHENTIEVEISGNAVSTFKGDYDFESIDICYNKKIIVAGDKFGNVHILKMENF